MNDAEALAAIDLELYGRELPYNPDRALTIRTMRQLYNQGIADSERARKTSEDERDGARHQASASAAEAERLGTALQALSDASDIVNGTIDKETETQRREHGPDWSDDQEFEVSLPWREIKGMNDAICHAQRALRPAHLLITPDASRSPAA